MAWQVQSVLVVVNDRKPCSEDGRGSSTASDDGSLDNWQRRRRADTLNNMPPARVMVTCKKCGKGFPTGQIIPDMSKSKPGDNPIVVATCSHCGHQDAYGPSNFRLAAI
jgi:RNase P subunit RPR2